MGAHEEAAAAAALQAVDHNLRGWTRRQVDAWDWERRARAEEHSDHG